MEVDLRLNIVEVEKVLRWLIKNGRFQFNSTQVAYLSGHRGIKSVHEYLLTKVPYAFTLKYGFVVDKKCELFDSLIEALELSSKYFPSYSADQLKQSAQLVFIFNEEYVRQVLELESVNELV